MTSHHAFTAQACRSAAEEWAASGNPVHEREAAWLEGMAANAEARALACGDQLELELV